MTIIVEDGSIVAGANSYSSEANLTAYATARGITLTTSTETLLIKGMDYIENQNYSGTKSTEDQPLQYPRHGVRIDGYLLSSDEIPQLLIDTLCEVCIAIDAGEDPLANLPRLKKRVTVGPISTEYESGQSTTIVRRINNKLRKLLAGGGSNGGSFTVGRG